MDGRVWDGPTRILVGVDPTDTAMRAGAYAAGMARRQHSQLIVVHVQRPVGAGAGLVGAGALMTEAGRQIGDDLERAVYAACRPLQIEVVFLRRFGDPATELLKVADEFRVDAIAVGASEHLGHRLVGSLATRLVRGARWPITVVP